MFTIRIVIFLLIAFPISGLAQSAFEQAKNAATQGDFLSAAPLISRAVAEQPSDPEVLYYATMIFSELESHDTAVTFGSRLYAENNDEPRYVQMFALALTRSKQPLDAVKILRRLQRNSDDVRTSLLLVNALIDADSLATAELIATTAKKKFPNSADAYFALGLLYYKYKPQPVLELAVQNLEEGLKLDDKLIQAHFTLGEAYWRMANRESDKDLANELFKRSLVEWNKVTELEPKNARAWFEQGKIFFLAERWKDCIATLLKYRELRPVGTGNSIASWYLGTAYFKMNLCDSAQIHLQDASALIDSLKAQASLQLGKCKFLSKDWVGSVDAYDHAYEKGTFNTWESNDAWFYGAALVLSGDTTRGIAIMTDAAIRDPKQCGFMFRFGVLLQKRQPAFSTKIFRQRLEFCTDSLSGKIHLFIGNNFFADSLVDSAVAEYETALKIEPGNGYYLTRLAETYAVTGNEAKAREIYQQVVGKGMTSEATEADKQAAISAVIKLNGLDVTAKQWGEIVSRCKSTLSLDPKNKWLILYLAIGYQGGGSTEDACKWYKELLKVDPANETAKKNTKALGC